MAKDIKQLLQQIDYHRAGRRKALREAHSHDVAECKLLREAAKDHGVKLGLDDDAIANSFAPKDD